MAAPFMKLMTVHDVLKAGRNIWNRDDGNIVKKEGTVMEEDRLFHETFGCSPSVACTLWNLLYKTGFLPSKGTLPIFLWALMTLKVYAKESSLCALAGNVDKKTFRRWVWAEFIPAIASMEPHVVGIFFFVVLSSAFSAALLLYQHFVYLTSTKLLLHHSLFAALWWGYVIDNIWKSIQN